MCLGTKTLLTGNAVMKVWRSKSCCLLHQQNGWTCVKPQLCDLYGDKESHRKSM